MRKNSPACFDSMGDLFKDSAFHDGFIDVCHVSTVVSRHTRGRCYLLMSLLAYAAMYNQQTMVDTLIKRNASESPLFGLPSLSNTSNISLLKT